MTAEADAHHVINLALMPVSGPPNTDNAGNLTLFLTDISLKAEVLQMSVTIHVIDQREARIVSIVVHARNIDQVIEAELLFGKLANFGNLFRVRDLKCDFAAEFC